MTIKLITGLGNIGSEYRNTRHNIGHKYVQLLSKTYEVSLKKSYLLSGYIGELRICNKIVYLFVPNSYVNNSGNAISKCVNYYQFFLREILIAHDELDLVPGSIRIKLGTKRNETHRGIKNIIEKLDDNFNFYRLRIGIGRPKNKNEVAHFVLSKPSNTETNKINFVLNETISYTEDIILGNFSKVMNILHSYTV